MTVPLPVTEPVSPPPLPPLAPERSVLAWNVAALVWALATVAGSLWLSLGMGLRACPLCFYQRAFVMGVAAVLLVSLFTESRGSASVSVMALALAAAGLCVAGFHVYLDTVGRLECPAGWLGVGSAPQQSLGAISVLCVILLLAGLRRPVMVLAPILGGIMALGSVISTPPPEQPTKAYAVGPILGCRVPYHGQE